MLVPNTLVDHICVLKDGTIDKTLEELVAKAEKITFLSPELTWVIHGINKIQCKRVYLDHVVMNDFDPIDLEAIKKHIAAEGLFCPNPDFLERDVWIEEAK